MVPGFHVINALSPVADAFATEKDTDIVDAGVGDGVLFIIHTGVASAAATSTLTVEASSTIGAAATAVVPFVYRECLATDVWGDWTAATTTGYLATMTASNGMWMVYVDSAEIAEEGYRYVRLSTDEGSGGAVVGGVLAIIINPRYSVANESALD